MSKTNTVMASDSSTSDDTGELETARVSGARERLKPQHHSLFFYFCRRRLEVNHRCSLCFHVWADLLNLLWTLDHDLWFVEYDRGQAQIDTGEYKPPATWWIGTCNSSTDPGLDILFCLWAPVCRAWKLRYEQQVTYFTQKTNVLNEMNGLIPCSCFR